MRSRREITPIWRDVKQGTPTRFSSGRYVTNDGETAPEYYGSIVQLNGTYVRQLNGSRIRRLDKL